MPPQEFIIVYTGIIVAIRKFSLPSFPSRGEFDAFMASCYSSFTFKGRVSKSSLRRVLTIVGAGVAKIP